MGSRHRTPIAKLSRVGGPHTEHAKGLAVMGPVVDEVIGPNLVLPLGVQADTGAAG